jgi:hypothetical protein
VAGTPIDPVTLQENRRLSDSESFIEFMLNTILQALEELPSRKITDKITKAEWEFLEQIAGYLDRNGEISNYRAQLLTGKSDCLYLGKTSQFDARCSIYMYIWLAPCIKDKKLLSNCLSKFFDSCGQRLIFIE